MSIQKAPAKLPVDMEVTYENDAVSSYLVFKVPGEMKVIEYQIEMISRNHSNGYLSLDLRRRDNVTTLYYNITSRVALSNLSIRKKFTRREFAQLLTNIINTLLQCRNYYLKETNFLLDEEFIYLNPHSLEISLVYVPCTEPVSGLEEFRIFVKKLITDVIHFNDSEDGRFLQKILNYLRADDFSFSGFNLILNELGNESFNTDESQKVEWVTSRSNTDEPPQKEMRNVFGFSSNRGIHEELPASDDNSKFKKAETANHTPQQMVNKTDNKSNADHKNMILKIILAQLAIIILCMLTYQYTETALGSLLACALVASAGIICEAIVFLLVIKKDQGNGNNVKIGLPKSKLETTYEVSDISEKVSESPKDYTHAAFSPFCPEYAVSPADKKMFYDGGQDTVILGVGKNNIPSLVNMKDDKGIEISKLPFMIGRLKGQVDMSIENETVGKIHAVITTKNGNYFIKDLNSKNGTFINGGRINSNIDYELKANDQLSFSNCRYIFTSCMGGI